MGTLNSVVGVPHLPFHLRSISARRGEWPPTVRMEEVGAMVRKLVAESSPDSLVVVGNDHAHQFFLDNMPQFFLGKMERFDAIFYNGVREFGIDSVILPGDIELAASLLEGAVERGGDLPFSNELKVDHSILTPLHFVRPDHELPIVPLMTNCVARPMPTARRLYEVGRILREIIEGLPDEERVAVVVSGHMSIGVGGPRQFLAGPTDEELDDTVTRLIAEGRDSELIDFCTFERMTQAGNATYQFANFILAMGAKGELGSCT